MSRVRHEPLQPYYLANVLEAGCDEAGRGCLAGPVFAAAVILPPNVNWPLLNDSKQLTDKQREQLRPLIEQEALAWCVAQVSAAEIDKINILNASILAMHRALDVSVNGKTKRHYNTNTRKRSLTVIVLFVTSLMFGYSLLVLLYWTIKFLWRVHLS